MSETPRTDETEKIADKLNAPAAAYGFTLARLKQMELELTAAREELEIAKRDLSDGHAQWIMDCDIIQAVTEQRDALLAACQDVVDSGGNFGDLVSASSNCRRLLRDRPDLGDRAASVDKLIKQRDRLAKEVEILRLYGNRDCLAMADEALQSLTTNEIEQL